MIRDLINTLKELKMIIEKVFKQLQLNRICNSGYDFSTKYLGKSKSYFSVLKTRNNEPTIDTLMMLELTLKKKASFYVNNKYPIFAIRRNQLLTLSNEVSDVRKKRLNDKLKCYEYVVTA